MREEGSRADIINLKAWSVFMHVVYSGGDWVRLKYEMLVWRTKCLLELWGKLAVSVCVCVWWGCVCVGRVGGCLHGCVNEEVISGVNAWQRAKRWPLQGGNRGEEGKDYKKAEHDQVKEEAEIRWELSGGKRGQGDSRAEGRKRSGMGLVRDEGSPTRGSDYRLCRKL